MTEPRALVRGALSAVAPHDPGPSVMELEARFGVSGLVKLNWNEDLFGLLPGVGEAVVGELAHVSRYPEQAYNSFRALVSKWAGADPAMVVPAHGIQALVLATALVFLEPGDKVVLPAPTYGLYRQACTAAGAEVVFVRTRGYRLDLGAMIRAAHGAKLVFVCDPNNPTGDALLPSEWQQFLSDLPDGCLAVVDEAYADYMTRDQRPDRVADVAAGRPVIVLRTFSKLFGLAGLRLGYGLVHPSLVPCFDAVQEPFNVNRPALAAGRACLAAPDAVEARRLEVVAARDRFARALAGIGIPSWPSQANFVLAEPGGDDLPWYEGLVRRGFLVRAGSEFGLPGHLRITVGPSELMNRVAGAMMAVREELMAAGTAGEG
ncbi:MAG TPA: histidinol-phosphate transaminase [Streptosporangiaceae bacterium]|nr:histidinol-phosphate transaminase [Streptosporangiaceae bacterium]